MIRLRSVLEPLLAQQKTMRVEAAVLITSHDVAPRVDVGGNRRTSSWHIDCGKLTFAQQKAVLADVFGEVVTYGVAFRIDPDHSGTNRSRKIDCREFPSAQNKAMRIVVAVKIVPDDL